MKERIIIILGQTATGKSDLSIKIAEKYPAEIVNADSMQVYKYMDIGTCKLSPSKRKSIPHHLLDIVEPKEEYNAGTFCFDAKKAISSIYSKNKTPIIVGGTGLYIRCLIGGIFELKEDTKDARKVLLEKLEKNGLETLYKELAQVDPLSAEKIKSSDKQRILRALEVYKASGIPISELQKKHEFKEKNFSYIKIGLRIEKDELLERIKIRIDNMFSEGLISEVETLLKKGYKDHLKALNSIAYRETIDLIEGKIDLDEAKEQTYKRTKDYAKRQNTWFKKDNEIKWFSPGIDLVKVFEYVEQFIGG